VTRAVVAATCPAKVNLALRILGRRPDGYHEIDTLFQAIDLSDEIEARPGASLTLSCDDPRLPTDDSNLALRAARRLAEAAGRPQVGAALALKKRIPAGAGLGGASSDAAAALLVCARLWGLPHAPDDLAAIAAEIGSDVPFFLWGGTARGTGRGERIVPQAYVGALPLLLGFPPFGIATAEVYRRFAQRLTLPGFDVSVPPFPPFPWSRDEDWGALINDLERVVFEDWPELRSFRDGLLEAGARSALLSGSGSTVYGVFADERSSMAAAGALAARFPSWRLVPTRAIAGGVRLVA
jgi:4-diphosphocytidyl-2-C-methyl-D-erythritol kinase